MTFLLLLLLVVEIFSIVCDPVPGTPINEPMGKGKGIKPGRVGWYYNKETCQWDGTTGYYWEQPNINQTLLDDMLSKTVISVSGITTTNPKDAWSSIFQHFNQKHTSKPTGYKTGEKIAIKMNLNVEYAGYQHQDNSNSITPQFIKSMLRQLVYNAGVPAKDIYIYDAARWMITTFWDPPVGVGAEFPDVNMYDTAGGMSWTKKANPDMNTMFFFSNREVAAWNESKLPQILTDAKYLIQVDAFRGHDLAGMTMSGKNWFGSIWRPDVACDFLGQLPHHWCPESLHQWVNVTGRSVQMPGGWRPQRKMGQYNPLVDLLGHDSTANGKGLIFFSDALYSGQAELPKYEPIRYQMSPFDNNYMCSVFASIDPVALDSVAFDFLRTEPNQPFPKEGCVDNYMHEGAMANDPVSGTKYAPSGHEIDSLGVHEHWNNGEDKLYSRNLGRNEGIELIQVHEL